MAESWINDVGLYFDTEEKIPYEKIAELLKGIDSATNLIPQLLKELYPDIKINNWEVSFKSVDIGSLDSNFIFKMLGISDDDVMKFGDDTVDHLSRVLKMEVQTVKRLIMITAVFCVFAAAGGGTALIYKQLFSENSNKSNNTSAGDSNSGNIYNITINELNITEEQFNKCIKKIINKNGRLSKNATKVLTVAKDYNAEIKTSHRGDILVSKRVLTNLPDIKDDNSEIINLENKKIKIRQLNFEDRHSGWGGKILNASEAGILPNEKVRLELIKEINPDTITFNEDKIITVDLVIKYKQLNNDKRKLISGTITRIYNKNELSTSQLDLFNFALDEKITTGTKCLKAPLEIND